jgi:tetratricopeptide (TPR) repeat protein
MIQKSHTPGQLLAHLKLSPVELGRDLHDESRIVREGLDGLARVGLIDINDKLGLHGTDAITIHPVIADASRARLLKKSRTELPAVSDAAVWLLQIASKRLDSTKPADWVEWHQLVPHISAILEWSPTYLDRPVLINLLDVACEAADAMWRSSSLAASERLARISVKAAKRLGPDNAASLTCRHTLATAIAFQARYEEGENIGHQPNAYPRSQGAVASSVRSDTDSSKNRYKEAERMYKQLLPDEQRFLGSNHLSTLSTRHRLAWVIALQGRYSEAEQLYRQLLPDEQRALGDDHQETLITRHRLAWVTALQGRYSEAEQLYRRLLPDQQRVLGHDQYDTLATRPRLAWVVASQGRYAEAEELYSQLLPDERRTFGDDHQETLITRHRLAWLVGLQGRRKEAEQMYRQLLPDQQRVLGYDHPDTRAARSELRLMAARGCRPTRGSQRPR